MLIQCPTHGETEAYDTGGYSGYCKICHRADKTRYRLEKAKGIFVPKREKREPKKYVIERKPRSDPWLTCNQVGCGLVCADIHELYSHKRGHCAVPEPEPYSLLQSTLRWV